MNERNMTVNISGKQINIAKDNATIRAIQNNRIEEKELDVAIKEYIRANKRGNGQRKPKNKSFTKLFETY